MAGSMYCTVQLNNFPKTREYVVFEARLTLGVVLKTRKKTLGESHCNEILGFLPGLQRKRTNSLI